MVITMAKLRMAHASTHGARKPPGPKLHLLVVNFAVMYIETGWSTETEILKISRVGQVKL